MTVQHSTIVAMGVRWLSRQCSVVLYEFSTAADENPDVIGWAPAAGSVLIECKLSRQFLKSPALANTDGSLSSETKITSESGKFAAVGQMQWRTGESGKWTLAIQRPKGIDV